MRIAGFVLLLALVISVSSCGGGSSSPERGATSVVVTPSTTTVLRGETQQFTAQVSGQTNQSVTWSIRPNLGSISPSGLYTAPSGSDGGPAVFVRATSKVVPSASGTAVVVRPTTMILG